MQAEQANGTMRVAATVKHFIYGSSEGGVNIAPMAGGINDFYNIYSVPFRAVIKEANPASLMPAYAAYDGVPAHGSTQYTHDFLRGELGFQGVVTSDFVGISDLHEAHAVCDSITAAGLLAMQVGIDHEIGVPAERAGFQMLSTLADDPEVQALVKQAAGRILTMKMLTGTFDQPTPDLSKINSTVRTPEHQALNLNVSKETMVLLKNDGLLPIAVGSDLLSNVAVIGPLAQFISDGSYAATDFITGSTILRGIQSIAKTATYSVGCTINDAAASAAQISAAVSVAQAAKLAVVVVGSSSSNLPGVYRTDGEGIDHALLDFPAPQNDMLAAIVATGVPVLVVVSGGQAFEMDYAAENANALIHTFLQGEEGGNALASIITGETNPSGKLSVSIPHLSSEIPIFYNNLPTAHKLGWPYYDWQYPLNQRTARYPFGYGLSYTSFSFSGVSVATASTTGSISVSATITNSGAVKGKEVVQVYYGQAFARIERPYKNLIRFDKIELEAGASQTVSFDIPVEEMGYYVNGKKFVDAGTYYVWVGSSSAAVDLVMTTIVVT
jgi:beta-glucosidase